jgi:hypothetical protein
LRLFVNLTPFIPLSWKERGREKKKSPDQSGLLDTHVAVGEGE